MDQEVEYYKLLLPCTFSVLLGQVCYVARKKKGARKRSHCISPLKCPWKNMSRSLSFSLSLSLSLFLLPRCAKMLIVFAAHAQREISNWNVKCSAEAFNMFHCSVMNERDFKKSHYSNGLLLSILVVFFGLWTSLTRYGKIISMDNLVILTKRTYGHAGLHL